MKRIHYGPRGGSSFNGVPMWACGRSRPWSPPGTERLDAVTCRLCLATDVYIRDHAEHAAIERARAIESLKAALAPTTQDGDTDHGA